MLRTETDGSLGGDDSSEDRGELDAPRRDEVERMHRDGEEAVRLEPGLLAELTSRRILETLAGLDLAVDHLPGPRASGPRRALQHEDLPPSLDRPPHEDVDDAPLSTIVARFPRYAILKEKLDRPDAPLDAVYGALRDAFPDATVDTQDGLRLGWPDRWVHVRPSGTEPIVRVIAEAPTVEGAQALVARGRALLAALV